MNREPSTVIFREYCCEHEPAEIIPIALLTEQKFLTVVLPGPPCTIIF